MKIQFSILMFFLLSVFNSFSQTEKGYSFIVSGNVKITLKLKKSNDKTSAATKYLVYATVSDGNIPNNVIYDWNLSIAGSNKAKAYHNVRLVLVKGNQNIFEKKIDSFYNYADYLDIPSRPTEKIIIVPDNIQVSGATTITEGENVNLAVNYTNDASDYTWEWYKIGASKKDILISKGATLSTAFNNSGNISCYVVGVNNKYKGVATEKHTFNVNVTPLWVPDADDIEVSASPKTINKGESVTLSVVYDGRKSGNLTWKWYADGVPMDKTGWRITDYPKKSTSYSVKAEVNYGTKIKQSGLSSLSKVEVKLPPEAPVLVAIKTDRPTNIVKEGEPITFTVNSNSKSQHSGRETYRWTNKKTGEVWNKTDNTFTISPKESTVFEVSSVLNSGGYTDISDPKTIEVIVIRKTVLPEIITNTTFCLSGKENYKSIPIKMENGVLGNGSKKWILFKGEYGSPSEKIDSTFGNRFVVPFPNTTTNYYITPDREPEKYKKFTISILSKPNIDKWSLFVDKPTICKGESVTVKLKSDNIPSGTEFKWDATQTNPAGKLPSSETKKITISPTTTGKITLSLTNKPCEINKKFIADVQVLIPPTNSTNNFQINGPYPKMGLRRSINMVYANDDKNVDLFWTTDNDTAKVFESNPIFTNKKIDTIYLWASNSCGTINIKTIKVNWKTTLRDYAFFNLGTINSQPNQFFSKNIMMTAGTEKFYFRTKLSLNSMIFVVPTYTSNNTNILDYPINSNTYYEFTGDVDNRRNSVVVGMFLPGNVIKPYFGAGYGAKNTIWRANIYQYYSNEKLHSRQVRNIDQQSRGLELEAGLFFDFGKSQTQYSVIHGINIISGFNCILDFKNNKQYFDTQIGIGINLDKPLWL